MAVVKLGAGPPITGRMMIREISGRWYQLEAGHADIDVSWERWADGSGQWVTRDWIWRGGRLDGGVWSKGELDGHVEVAQGQPAILTTTEEMGHRVWQRGDRYYLAEANCSQADVEAFYVVAEAERARSRQTLHDRAAAVTGGAQGRTPIPREVRYAVWERDGGQCAQCGATFDLQYDHIIPVSKGGATSVANLELLCGTCNRAKAATLG
jgi:5-methylcytosine-specific restriction endonuclease McrA